ncbi:MAG: hypothetical protein ACJ764_07975 [Solirubrobacteraceae bacterium]
MNFVRPIWQDLKTKRLWPVAVGLLVAIVAVPVLLSSSATVPPAASASLPPTSPPDALPAVSNTTPPGGGVKGAARDPFTPPSGGSHVAPAVVAARPVSTGTSTSGGSGSIPSTGSVPSTGPAPSTSSGSSGGPTTSGGGSGPTSSGGGTPTVPSNIPVPKPKPAIPSLRPNQSYSVTLAMTNSAGGINTIDPLQRLSLLPSSSRPMLVELGVLRGGSRVLFAVEPGTVVSGRGSCVPGPIDCEILSLGQGQTEKVSLRSTHGVTPVAMFAVTGIAVRNHASAGASQKVRRAQSAVGRRVLNHSPLGALSLFRYEPSVGAVVDLRNLTLRNS